MKKYEFTGETIVIGDVTLQRIRALVAIPTAGVCADDLGGWILSHDDNAWVYDNARACGDAWVCGDAHSPLIY